MTPSVPPPQAICLDCRRFLAPEERCGRRGEHRTTRLVAGQFESLNKVVWGAYPWLRVPVNDGSAGVALLVVGSVLVISSGGSLAGAGIALLGMVLALRRRKTLRPFGARFPPAAPPVGETRSGTVRATGDRMTAPLSGRSCVAWSVEICASTAEGSVVMARQCWSAGFDVFLPSGERVRIPAGPLFFHPERSERFSRFDGIPLQAYVQSPAFPPIPAEWAWEAVLSDQDEVRITAVLERREDEAGRGLPRDAAATVLVAAGVPVVDWEGG